MAKAKKSESTEKTAKPAAPKKAASKSKKTEKKPGGATPNLLGIDTGLAASAAAMAIANKALLHQNQAQAAQGDKKESAVFKQLKQQVSKPTLPTSLLGGDTGPASRKSNLPFGGGKQVGHNQTFGADVTRSGVPRRTPG